jgi:hypothetical protein
MSRAPSTLPPISPLSRAMVPYKPRASSTTPSVSRKRSLGMLSEMSRVSLKMVIGEGLTRCRCQRAHFLMNLYLSPEPGLPRPLDTGSRPRRLPLADLEDPLRYVRCPVSPSPTRILARELAGQRLLITIDEVEMSDRGNLVRVQPVPRRLHHPFPPSHLSSWSPPQPSTISSEHFMFRI